MQFRNLDVFLIEASNDPRWLAVIDNIPGALALIRSRAPQSAG